jgi:hypothetical protein
MAMDQAIAPFPDDVDREAFGHWLSGFVDGEGSFDLSVFRTGEHTRPSFHARLNITIRDDDADILRSIQSYFGCGRLTFHGNVRRRIPNANPVAKISIHRVPELMTAIIPHFERFPLRAKKRRDYAIWRQGVELMSAVYGRRRTFAPGTCVGCKWTDAEREQFRRLAEALVGQRRYGGRSPGELGSRIPTLVFPADPQQILFT